MSSCVVSTVVVVVLLTVFVIAITWSVCDAAPTLLPTRVYTPHSLRVAIARGSLQGGGRADVLCPASLTTGTLAGAHHSSSSR